MFIERIGEPRHRYIRSYFNVSRRHETSRRVVKGYDIRDGVSSRRNLFECLKLGQKVRRFNLFEIIVLVVDIHVVNVRLVEDDGGDGNIVRTTHTGNKNSTRSSVFSCTHTYILNEIGVRTVGLYI